MEMSFDKLFVHLTDLYFDFYFFNVLFDTCFKMGNIFRNIFDAIFKWNDFVGFMFIISINAMDAKNFIFSLTIETEIVIMLKTSLLTNL